MRFLYRMSSPFPFYKVRIHGGSARVIGLSWSGSRIRICGYDESGFGLLPGMSGDLERSRYAVPWDLDDGPPESFLDVDFHPDDERMALVGRGRPIQIHRLHDGSLIQSIGRGPDTIGGKKGPPPSFSRFSGYGCVAFSDLGTRVMAACSQFGYLQGELYDLEQDKLVASFCGGQSHYAYLPDWDLLATARNDQGGASIQFFQPMEAFTGSQEYGDGPPQVRTHNEEDIYGWDPDLLEVTGMRFNPDGDRLAVSGGTVDHGVSLFEFPGGRLLFRYVQEPRDFVNEFGYPIDQGPVFHPDGQRLLIPLPSGAIVEVDATTGKEIRRHPVFEAPCTAVDADYSEGRVVACSARGEVVLLEIQE
jgi:WD40 repeat protein